MQREQEKQMRRAEKHERKQESRAAAEERARHEEALKDVSDADMVLRYDFVNAPFTELTAADFSR